MNPDTIRQRLFLALLIGSSALVAVIWCLL